MAADITMPRLSDSMEEGTVAKWHVAVGATVERGQVLAEIDTDKATMEYEAEVAGTILEIMVSEGESAPIGAPIARIGEPGEAPAEPAVSRAAPAAERAPRPEPTAAPVRAAAAGQSGRANASPVARRLAAELGVDLTSLQGSGPGGQITKEDVQRAAGGDEVAAAAPAPFIKGDVKLVEATRVQQVIARRMAEGSAVPTFAVDIEIDMSAVVSRRRELEQEQDPPPSLNDFVVRAAALALRDSPRVNGSYTDRGFELYSKINVGIAVATEDALLVPTIFDADAKPLSAIAAEARELAAKVRNGTVTAHELEGGTFTVTNLGMFGTSRFLAIINPPQAAILAVGAVTRRPAFDESGSVVARELMSATLVCDHRIVYGADGARFLARLRELLEQPAPLT